MIKRRWLLDAGPLFPFSQVMHDFFSGDVFRPCAHANVHIQEVHPVSGCQEGIEIIWRLSQTWTFTNVLGCCCLFVFFKNKKKHMVFKFPSKDFRRPPCCDHRDIPSTGWLSSIPMIIWQPWSLSWRGCDTSAVAPYRYPMMEECLNSSFMKWNAPYCMIPAVFSLGFIERFQGCHELELERRTL